MVSTTKPLIYELKTPQILWWLGPFCPWCPAGPGKMVSTIRTKNTYQSSKAAWGVSWMVKICKVMWWSSSIPGNSVGGLFWMVRSSFQKISALGDKKITLNQMNREFAADRKTSPESTVIVGSSRPHGPESSQIVSYQSEIIPQPRILARHHQDYDIFSFGNPNL